MSLRIISHLKQRASEIFTTKNELDTLLENKAETDELPENISDLTDDMIFIDEIDFDSLIYYLETD